MVFHKRYMGQSNIVRIGDYDFGYLPEEIFFNTLKGAVNSYWEEVMSLNPVLSGYLENFKIS